MGGKGEKRTCSDRSTISQGREQTEAESVLVSLRTSGGALRGLCTIFSDTALSCYPDREVTAPSEKRHLKRNQVLSLFERSTARIYASCSRECTAANEA